MRRFKSKTLTCSGSVRILGLKRTVSSCAIDYKSICDSTAITPVSHPLPPYSLTKRDNHWQKESHIVSYIILPGENIGQTSFNASKAILNNICCLSAMPTPTTSVMPENIPNILCLSVAPSKIKTATNLNR